VIANREAIYSALYDVVRAAAPFVTTSRRLKHWADIPAEEQPALFMVQKNEGVSQVKGLPSKNTLFVDLYVYAKTGEGEETPPATILNPLVDAIDQTLSPSPATGYFSLVVDGQDVSHCWIDGEIVNDEGVLGSQAVAIIPVKIMAV